MKAVDLLNIWGLVFIGLGLFLGIFTRIASTAGACLLLLYYIANPPFVGFVSEVTSEGHYLVVNKNIIEMTLLIIFIVIPRNMMYGFDRLLTRIIQKRKNADPQSTQTTNEARRELLKDLVSLPLSGAFLYGVFKKRQWESFEERHLISKPSRLDAVTGASPVGVSFKSLSELSAKVPCGKIKNMEISRLICGGNLISGYAHSRDLIYVSALMQSYFSDEKVIETLQLCEHCGINTAILRVDRNTLRIIEKYRKRGGKIQWISQAKITDDDLRSDIDASIDNGADAVYIHGGVCDKFVDMNKVDRLNEAIEYIKKRGVIAGIAGHDLRVPITCEKLGLDPDFYMKTLNSGNYWTAGPRLIKDAKWKPNPSLIVEPEYSKKTNDNIWSITPEQTIEFMKTVQKPWIAYKVLGAGAIKPKEGFQYAFENGADFICVGMFDFQVVEDANILNEVLNGNRKRQRPWMA